MPRLLDGFWAAGVGGGIASVGRVGDPVPLAVWTNAGGTCWLASGLALFQHGAHLETFDLRNGEHHETVDSQGAYELAAGGHVYAAKFDDGVRISTQPGQRYPGYGVGDVAPDGTVLLKTPDGLLDGVLYASIQALPGGGFVGLDASYRPAAGRGAVAPVALPGRIYGLRVHGDLCCYHAEDGGRLIVQRTDSLVGVEVARGLPACYRPDFEERDGSIAVVYATKESEAPGELVFASVTRAQFAALAPLTAPPVTPPPPIVPPPPPEPKPVSIPNQLSTVQRIRAKYPTPLGAQHSAFLIEVAQATGAKLLRKDGGTHVTLPTGVNVSQDILMFLDQGVDILSDAEGAAVASWQEKGTIAGEYIDVGGISAPGQPPPVTPPPPAPPAKNYDAEIDALQAEIDAIRTRLDALPPTPPAPDLSGYAKKGDAVTVNAKVFGYPLVGHGSIDK